MPYLSNPAGALRGALSALKEIKNMVDDIRNPPTRPPVSVITCEQTMALLATAYMGLYTKEGDLLARLDLWPQGYLVQTTFHLEGLALTSGRVDHALVINRGSQEVIGPRIDVGEECAFTMTEYDLVRDQPVTAQIEAKDMSNGYQPKAAEGEPVKVGDMIPPEGFGQTSGFKGTPKAADTLPFTRFTPPLGERSIEHFKVSPEIHEKGRYCIAQGALFTIERLSTGQQSVACEYSSDNYEEQDIASQLTRTGLPLENCITDLVIR